MNTRTTLWKLLYFSEIRKNNFPLLYGNRLKNLKGTDFVEFGIPMKILALSYSVSQCNNHTAQSFGGFGGQLYSNPPKFYNSSSNVMKN